ncbi:MAG: hypothetical protein E6J87_08495 [Deltaproteobacteria bacterium]|nr:MAG: hypothetical protein E6J87_08495 [Deltaproteobacteria bacterium]
MNHRTKHLIGVSTAALALFAWGRVAFSGEIHDAAKANDVEKVKTLLANGVDVKAKDNEGDSPLHVAAKHNAKETVTLLLDKGSDV